MSDSTPTLERAARAIAERNRPRDFTPDAWWAMRGDDFTADARAALDASGNDELVEAAQRLVTAIQCNAGVEYAAALSCLKSAIARTQEQSDG